MRHRHFHSRLGRCLVSGTPYLGAFTALAAGLIVLAYAIHGPQVGEWASQALDNGDWTIAPTWAAMLYMAGLTALQTLPAVIAAYVAHSVADRSAIIPGFLGGVAAIVAEGGVLCGVVAGAAVLALQRIPVKRALHSTTAVLFPLLATVITLFVTLAVADRCSRP